MLTAEKENAPLAGEATMQNGQYAGSVAVSQGVGNAKRPLLPFRGFAIPDELKRNARWAPWRAEWNENRNKWDKIPGFGLSTKEPERWSSYPSALATFTKHRPQFAGIGYCLTGPHGIVGIDLDDCIEAGVVAPWAAEVVEKLGSYTERSPSGNGLRIIVTGEIACDWTNNEAGIEVYGGNTARFLTITGDHLAGTPLVVAAADPAVLNALAEQYARPRKAAEIIDLEAPDILDDFLLPSIDKLPLHDKAAAFLMQGEVDGDRSRTLHAAGVALYSAGLNDAEVFSILATNEHAMAVALDHRRQDPDRAMLYLWREHCMKAKSKATTVATIDDFEVVEDVSDLIGAEPSEPPHFAFYAYLPAHQYLHRPTRAFWPAASVDGHLASKIDGKKVTTWLDRFRAVQQATWHPAHGELLKDLVVADGGFVPRPGALVYNRYRPPIIKPSDASAQPWLDHLHAIYPGEAEHLVKWFAHRIQRPGEKINHALVLGGSQGIGKDSLLEPVRRGVGAWNWQDIDPKKLTAAFNPFVESVVLRINEARDLGDLDRFAFYDHSKTYIAAPPDVLMCNNKHAKEYPVFNVMGVILTTNHKTNGIYLPLDDRRHFVAWSESNKEDFADDYWPGYWQWLNTGGDAAVVGYLQAVDLADFNPKAPPPKTEAFFAIVQANANPDDVALANLTLQADGSKLPAVTLDLLAAAAMDRDEVELMAVLTDPRNRRRIPHMLERAGYVSVRNPDAADGLWKVGSRRQVVYCESGQSLAERVKNARNLTGGGR